MRVFEQGLELLVEGGTGYAGTTPTAAEIRSERQDVLGEEQAAVLQVLSEVFLFWLSYAHLPVAAGHIEHQRVHDAPVV